MSLSSEGRSFTITQKGHYGLGPWIAEPGDIFCIPLGARVPFILRKTGKESFYKLVGEAYIHGFMRGEVGEGERFDSGDSYNLLARVFSKPCDPYEPVTIHQSI
jgi:hypothetical protein